MPRGLLLVLCLIGCRETTLPPPPGPGSVQGTLVYAEPGRLGVKRAVGAQVELLGAGAVAQADADGRFALFGVTRSDGALLCTFTKGGVTLTRLLGVSELGAGLGRTVVLQDVALSANGAASGHVQLADRPASNSGLGGVTVFAPGAPWTTFTGDDGSFLLEGLPAGSYQLAFYRDGYAPAAVELTIAGGQERALVPVVLEPLAKGPATVQLKVVGQDGAPAASARVTLRSAAGPTSLTLGADGSVRATVDPGVYALTIEREGSLSIALANVLLPTGLTDLGTFTLLDGPSKPPTVVVPPSYDGGPGVDGGMGDGGAAGDAGADAGLDGGSGADGGLVGPRALAFAPSVVAAGAKVTLSGLGSTGDFPLTYRWTQVGGPPVTLSVNESVLAHSPTFTAPLTIGSVLDFELVVVDQRGVSSQAAPVRVAVGGTPTARFRPDSGTLVFGSQQVPLTSTSTDDGGVAIVGFSWSLATGSSGSLVSDGGPSALFLAPAVAFGAPDVLAGVTLQVTSAIGAVSSPVTNTFTVRGASPNNWALDAGQSLAVAVGAVPPQVQLTATVSSPLVTSPQYSVSWACPPSLTLLGADTLTPRFVAPRVDGPNQVLACTVTAVGQPPLDPPTLVAGVQVLLQDTALPGARALGSPGRLSRFGWAAIASEDISLTGLNVGCTPGLSYGTVSRRFHRGVATGTAYTALHDGDLYSECWLSLQDLAPSPNVTSKASLFSSATQVATVWAGPFVSTATFDDPRPTVATLGQFPSEEKRVAGITSAAVSDYEVLASEAGALVRLAPLDVHATPLCEPSCAWSNTTAALALPTGARPLTRRTSFENGELFVAMSSDGGVGGTVTVQRDTQGTWSLGPPRGGLGMWETDLQQVRFEPDGGQLMLENWDGATRTFFPASIVATGVAQPLAAVPVDGQVVALLPTGGLLVRKYNASLATWSTVTSTASQINTLEVDSNGAEAFALLDSQPQHKLDVVRLASNSTFTINASGTQGAAFAAMGNQVYVVYSVNGDVHFKFIEGSTFSGAGGGGQDFGGPPRTGYSAPYPVILDADPICEAVFPHLAFIEDALLVVWQERCAPETRWRVVSRLVR